MSLDPASDAHVRIAIVGGGATGVELAAELYNAAAALRYYGLEVFDEDRLEVTLIEAGPRILPALPERLADAAREELEALGVRVLTDAPVTEVTPAAILIRSGERIEAELKIWAAGVRAAPLPGGVDGLELNRIGQFVVRPTLQTTIDDHIFAIAIAAAACCPAASGRCRPARRRRTRWHQPRSAIWCG